MARRDATVSAAALLGAAFALAGCGDHAGFTPRSSAMRTLVPLTVAPRRAPAVSRILRPPIQRTALSAAIAPRRITLPHAEVGGHLGSPETLALEFAARAGQVLEVRFEQRGADAVLAAEPSARRDASGANGLATLAAAAAAPARSAPELRVLIVDDALAARRQAELATAPAGASELYLRMPADADYVVELRPPSAGLYRLVLELHAPLPFPVMGYDHTAIRSYFGASRESGRRRHEGVDIFVPRLTPVVAVADGIVGLHVEGRGGIAVVLSIAGISYYYAHLDRTAVGDGQRVRIGDVLGYVGSTGNARGSAPHLHFGVYEFGKGAVDPLPLLEERRFAAADDAREPFAAAVAAVAGEAARGTVEPGAPQASTNVRRTAVGGMGGGEVAAAGYSGEGIAGGGIAGGGIAGGGIAVGGIAAGEIAAVGIAETALIAAAAGGCGMSVLADTSAGAVAAAGQAWWFEGGERLGSSAPNGAAVLCTDGT